MNYYIADLHLDHANIIRLNNRPYKDVGEMNRTFISNWNSVGTDNDDVYVVGDFSYKSKNPLVFLKQLKGRKHLIVGNHDEFMLKNPECRKQFVEIADILTVRDGDKTIVLCHYPFLEWNGFYRGWLHFYGHVHNTFHNETTKYAANMKNAYNVGVDIIGPTPKTMKQIIAA